MLKERFISFVKINSQSSSDSTTYPSTKSQLHFAKKLLLELNQLGIDAKIDKYGYLRGKLEGDIDKTILLVAHLDTSPDADGDNVTPQVIDYVGGDIILNKEQNIILSPSKFPALNKLIGHQLIVTDGTTLLGADDKAGIAIIFEVLQYYKDKTNRPTIMFIFTPDEEIGQGTKYLEIDENIDFAYTIDGGSSSVFSYECFNAASAIINFKGVNIHPGEAKDKMINALLIANHFIRLMPEELTPAKTEKREGFIHINKLCGDVSNATLQCIIREHDLDKFNSLLNQINTTAQNLSQLYGTEINVDITNQYYNMGDYIKNKDVINLPLQAMKHLNIQPDIIAIRGGTDGAMLTYKGIDCPNLGTGGGNFHSVYEYLSINQAIEVVNIIKYIIDNISS